MSVNWRASCLGIRNSVGLLAVSRSRIQTQLKLSYYTPVDSASSVFSSVRPPKSILSIFPSYTRELEMVKPPSTISRVLYSGLKGGKYGQTNGLCGKTWGIGDSYTFISKFCTAANPSKASAFEGSTPLPLRIGVSIVCLRLQYKQHYLRNKTHRRSFHDYITATLPSQSNSASSESMAVVRIPLKSAKQYFGVTRSRGNRPYNEDWYQAGVLDLPPVPASMPGHGTGTANSSGHGGKSGFISPSTLNSGPEPTVFYFAVFDGHGGDECSVFLKEHLHEYIETTAQWFHSLPTDSRSTGFSTTDSSKKPNEEVSGAVEEAELTEDHRERLQTSLITEWGEKIGGYFRRFKPVFGGDGSPENILTYAFLRADLDFIRDKVPRKTLIPSKDQSCNTAPENDKEPPGKTKLTSFKGGSTASVALIYSPTPPKTPFWDPSDTSKSMLITAHIGDTRILLSNTESGLAVPITTVHHPSAPTESRRLRRYAAEFMTDSFGQERFGILANTRSFGDVTHKMLGVTAEPEVSRREIFGKEWAFMVLCSDGVSGVLSDQEIVDIVKEGKTPEEGAKELVAFAEDVGAQGSGGTGGSDNATAMVVRLGGWDDRLEGGEGSRATKELRHWRLNELLEAGPRRT